MWKTIVSYFFNEPEPIPQQCEPAQRTLQERVQGAVTLIIGRRACGKTTLIDHLTKENDKVLRTSGRGMTAKRMLELVKEADTNTSLCVVIDDMVWNNPFADSQELAELVFNLRHIHPKLTVLITAQDIFIVPVRIRCNVEFVVFYGSPSDETCRLVWETWFDTMKKQDFDSELHEATARPYGCLMVDVAKKNACKDWHDCVEQIQPDII